MAEFVVGKNDNLYTIAKAFSERQEGLTYPMVAAFNGKDLKEADLIYPGDRFEIPELYTIKGGDTLGRIAKSLGVTPKELIDANKLLKPTLETKPGDIKAGAYLIIPRNAKGHYLDAVVTGERREAETAKEKFSEAAKIATDKRAGYEAKVGELAEKNVIAKTEFQKVKGEAAVGEKEFKAAVEAEAKAGAALAVASDDSRAAWKKRDDAQAELSDAETERSVAGSEVEIAKGAVEAAEGIRDDIKAEHADVHGKFKTAESVLATAQTVHADAKSERGLALSGIIATQKEFNGAGDVRDTAVRDRDGAKEALETAEGELANATDERDVAKTEQKKCLEKFEVADIALKDAEKQFEWAKDNRLGRAAKGKAQYRVEDGQDDYNEKGVALEGAEEKLDEASAKVTDKTVKVGETGKKLGEADQTLEGAEAYLETAKAMLAEAKVRLDKADETVGQTETRLAEAGEKFGQADQALMKADGELAKAEAFVVQTGDKLSEAEKKFTKADERFTLAEKGLKEAADGLEISIAAYQEKLSTWSGTDEELAQETQQLKEAQEKLATAAKTLNDSGVALADAYRERPAVEKAEAHSKAAGVHAAQEEADVKWAELLKGSTVHEKKTVINKGPLEAREWLQTTLKELGHYEGLVDGDIGKMSVAAIKEFQKDAGLKVDGVAGDNTVNAIKDALKAKIGDMEQTYHGPIPKNGVKDFVVNASAPQP